MKKVLAIAATGLLLTSLTCSAAGGWIESREAYNTASDKHELAFRGGYNFTNGAGVMLTNAYNTGTLDQLKHSYNELEGWYPFFHVTPQFTILPAFIVTSSNSGSGVSPYVDFNYKFTPDFNVTARVRYNHKNYDSQDINGEMNPDDTLQYVMYWNYKIDEVWSYTFEPDYYVRQNDFHSANGRDHSWELNNKLTYTIDKHWRLIPEASWLDRSEQYHREQFRFRLAVRYYF